MDAKQQILEQVITSKFDVDRYLKFCNELFNGLEVLAPHSPSDKVWSEYKDKIASYTTVGRYTNGKENIVVFAVKLQSGRSVERARSLQRNFIAKLLRGSTIFYDAAIVAFYSEDNEHWRLSFVRLDFEYAAGGPKELLTPAKRYSYLVGTGEPCHTAKQQLFQIFREENYSPTLDKIEEAFSVERVTDDFFEKYKEKYFELKEFLDTNKSFLDEAQQHEFTSEQFAKKLMGQLAFLYFLQKKGWLGVKVVPHQLNIEQYNFALSISNASKDVILKSYSLVGSDVYRLKPNSIFDLTALEADVLTKCFNAEPWGSGTKKFIRDLFTNCQKVERKNFFDDYLEPLFYEALNCKRGENNYYKRFNCKIPFLNGGLFEPLENYDWRNSKFGIPNELFSNKDIKGERDADGILDFFDRYNFTMNEDEPLEREVAVDPEMLGKIFENLLDAKDRKAKGAFYTPREIVHYMCQESLVNYLINETAIPYEDMKKFIIFGEMMRDEDCGKNVKIRQIPESVYEKLGLLDKALINIKVADPAVGSGAFPLGMLSEIVKARNNITSYFAQQLQSKIDKDRIQEQRDPYILKWQTIKNSIYAVDIEASAVDIAKLRLWLSIIVDETLETSYGDNSIGKQREPHPLPNLDYNIMCGNSLIDEFEGIKLFDESILNKESHNKVGATANWQLSLFIDSMDKLIVDLFMEQDKLFGEEDNERKKIIKANIDKIIDDVIKAKLQKDGNLLGIAKYKESQKQKTKPYFLWKLEFAKVFKEKGGFDVVIANPPYIDSENMVNNGMEALRNIIVANYTFTRGNWDIYIAFFEKSYSMLSKNGTLCFITPDKWISKPFGDEMRINLVKNIISILAAGRSVFEAALVDSIITLISKKESSVVKVLEMKNKKSPIILKRIVNKQILTKPFALDLIFSDSISLINKLDENNQILSQSFLCENACATSDCYKLKEILYSLENSESFLVEKHMKIINTGTIDRYTSRWGIKPMTYLKDKYLFPVVDKSKFFSMFANSYGQKSIKPKIIIKGLTLLDSCIDNDGIVIPGKSTMMISTNNEEDLKYLCAIINSKLMMFYVKQKYSSSSYNGGINFTKDMINNLPFVEVELRIKDSIISLVNRIIAQKQILCTKDTSDLETEINQIVYGLYGLTNEEVKIIEEA